MKEATIESRIDGVLLSIFPWLSTKNISHQESFKVKIGHRTIELKSDFIQGRLDILVSINDIPTIIFELKSDEVPICQDDIEQGISYAKLTNPLTPLVIISNTIKTEIYTSYNSQKIEIDDIGGEKSNFTRLLDSVMNLARDDIRNAIEILSGGSKSLIFEMFRTFTDNKFSAITGKIDEWCFPITSFIIDREIKEDILNVISNNINKKIILLSGAAQSGKTNLAYGLYYYFKEKKEVALYFDGYTSPSIFDSIENELSNYFKITLTQNDIINWLRSFVRNNNIQIIVDNLDIEYFRNNKNEILKIYNIFLSTHSTLILITNQITSELLFKQKGRNTFSEVTEKTIIFTLKNLSDNEFDKALEIFSKKNIFIDSGLFDEKEIRSPRILRYLISIAKDVDKKVVLLPTCLSEIFSYVRSSNIIDDDLIDILCQICKIHINEKINNKIDPFYLLMKVEAGCLKKDSILDQIKDENLDLLIENGLLKLFKNNDDLLIFPRDYLLFSYCAINIFASQIIQIFHSDQTFDEIIQKANYFKSNDLIVADSLRIVQKKDNEAFSSFVKYLLASEPTYIKPDKDTEMLTIIKSEERYHKLRFNTSVFEFIEEDDSGEMISNHLQWRIISILLLSNWFLELVDISSYLSIIYKIASHKRTLFRNSETSSNFSHYSHHFGDFEVACTNHYKGETISFVLDALFLMDTPSFIKLCSKALEDNNFSVLNRCICILNKHNMKKDEAYENIYKKHDELIQVLLNKKRLGRNDNCYCQSGKKYKRCCGK